MIPLVAALSLPFAPGAGPEIAWGTLPPLPDAEGFAGSFAGTSNGALIVAGGANFPDKKPWDGGAKVWHDPVFVLESPDGKWQRAGTLPRPLGYGAFADGPGGVLCIGGGDAARNYAACFVLGWADGKLTTTPAAPLPAPAAFLAAARLGDTVYAAGGVETPTGTTALKAFRALDVTKPGATWRTLDPLPGPGRILPAVAAADGAVFVFGGAALAAGPSGTPVRTYLRDGYRFNPGTGWKRVADLPRPAAGAPTAVVGGRVLLVSGDDGAGSGAKPQSEHPGFPKTVLVYDPKVDKWGEVPGPGSRATGPAAVWKGRAVFPGGELRPGVRSTETWTVTGR